MVLLIVYWIFFNVYALVKNPKLLGPLMIVVQNQRHWISCSKKQLYFFLINHSFGWTDPSSSTWFLTIYWHDIEKTIVIDNTTDLDAHTNRGKSSYRWAQDICHQNRQLTFVGYIWLEFSLDCSAPSNLSSLRVAAVYIITLAPSSSCLNFECSRELLGKTIWSRREDLIRARDWIPSMILLILHGFTIHKHTGRVP